MAIAEIWKLLSFFFFNDTATTEIYTLSLHDALPIYHFRVVAAAEDLHIGSASQRRANTYQQFPRSEEHTSELQSHLNLVCRLLLEKKNTTRTCVVASITVPGRIMLAVPQPCPLLILV